MTGRSRVLLLIAVLTAAGLAVSTGAVAWDPAGPLDSLGEDVTLQPTSEYATMAESETGEPELHIDLTDTNQNLAGAGLNPDATTMIQDVAAINYTGSQYAEVWVTHDIEGLAVSVDGTEIESRARNITLGPDERVGLDLAVQTADGTTIDGTLELAIHSRVAEPESTGGGAISTAETTETLTLTVTVREPEPGIREIDIQEVSADQLVDVTNLDLTRDGMTLEALSVRATETGNGVVTVDGTVEPPESAIEADLGVTPVGGFTLSQEGVTLDRYAVTGRVADSAIPEGANRSGLSVLALEDGQWRLLPTERSTGAESVAVEAAVDGTGEYALAVPAPRTGVRNATVSVGAIDLGESLTIRATVENTGTAAGSETVQFQVGDETVAETTVEVPAGGQIQVNTTYTPEEPGNRTVAVGGQPAGTVSVSDTQPADTPAEPTTTEPTTPEPTTEEPTPGPVEEPAAIALDRLLGLGLAGAMGGLLLFLFRRVSV